MKENTNKIIVVNTIILYLRLILTSVLGLFSTRFALQALGVVDYGLYSVLGSIITFIAIINTIMVSSSHRYIAVAIGKKDLKEANTIFNVCLVIHMVIAIVTLVLALPLGNCYIVNSLNYDGDINNAISVFSISIIASTFTFVGVPYNALLMAKERFIVFTIPDIISHILKLVIVIILLNDIGNKLLIYAASMAVLTVYPTIAYMLFCQKRYPEVCSFRIVKGSGMYREILSFSSWVAYGAFAYVGKNQGAAILVNNFFNTIMNTALGIANTVNSMIGHFSQNISKPIAPQITKSYEAGDYKRCENLLVLSTKMTYLSMLIVSSPFLVGAEWIMNLWLGKVPQYAVGFLFLIIVDSLIEALNAGIKEIIFASGKIKLYQIIPNTIKLISIGVAFLMMKIIENPYTILFVYIVFSFINFFVTQWILYYSLKFNNLLLIKRSYIPSLVVTMCFVPILIVHVNIYPLLLIVFSILYLMLVSFFVGFSSGERQAIMKLIKKR